MRKGTPPPIHSSLGASCFWCIPAVLRSSEASPCWPVYSLIRRGMAENHRGKKSRAAPFPHWRESIRQVKAIVYAYILSDSVRMICVSTKRRGCTRRQSHWMIRSKVGRSISASAFLLFYIKEEGKIDYKRSGSQFNVHSPERVDYKARFCDWQCDRWKRRNRRPYHRISFHKR